MSMATNCMAWSLRRKPDHPSPPGHSAWPAQPLRSASADPGSNMRKAASSHLLLVFMQRGNDAGKSGGRWRVAQQHLRVVPRNHMRRRLCQPPDPLPAFDHVAHVVDDGKMLAFPDVPVIVAGV